MRIFLAPILNFVYFIVSNAKILRFCQKIFLIGPLSREISSAYTENKRNRILLILILSNFAYTKYELKSIPLSRSVS